MKIAVNTRILLPNRLGGVGWFTYETLKRITQNHPEHQFHFLFDRQYHNDFIFSDNITPHIIHPQARHPFLFYLWFEHSLPRAFKTIKPDIFLSQDGYLSLNSKVKSLSVIHDINFHHFPKDVPYLVRKYYNFFFPRFAKHANRIATVSEFSKSDISQSYDINENKIDVVYNGVNKMYKPLNESINAETRKEHSNGCPYFLFVGTLLPRKNISNLMKSFDLFKQKTTSSVKLIIIGNKKWWTADMEAAYSNMVFKEEVIFKGYIQPDELHRILSAALALSFVPHFEGFGIPILEAMACGTPVITSKASSTQEVGADATILVDPYNCEEIADAMKAILEDENLRTKLAKAGAKRVTDFSWDKTADLLWKSIEKMM